MDFKDSIKQLAERVIKLKDSINTEEATKNAFIMPFINSLGYDVFNPLEVIPEMTCDIGTKKGEKVDYAIMKDQAPILLIECKHWAENLTLHDNQLLRYFNVSQAKFGLLTNGIIYKFYTDLKEPNKMDDKPFLEIDITELKDNQIEELKKFHKSYFDVNNILNTASELKYMGEIKNVIQALFTSPTPDFVKLLISDIYEGIKSTKVIEQFTPLVKKTISSYINDIINDKLKTILTPPEEENKPECEEIVEEEEVIKSDIITTEEELDVYRIVKAICCQKVDIHRIAYRDAKYYFNVLLDDNNRKPIFRAYFNTSKKYISTFETFAIDKKENKIQIESVEDVYKYKDQIIEAINKYDELYK